jgi:hypothetical protein
MLAMMTSPLIANLRGPSSKSHSGRRRWSELIAPWACLCLPAPPRRRLELSKFADADPFGVCAAGVVMRTVMTSSYKAVNRLPHLSRACQKKTSADVMAITKWTISDSRIGALSNPTDRSPDTRQDVRTHPIKTRRDL